MLRSRAVPLTMLLVACASTPPPASPVAAPPSIEIRETSDAGASVTAPVTAPPAEQAPAEQASEPPVELPPEPPAGSLPPPPVFAKLVAATSLELHDEWVGLGTNHDVVIRLDLAGDTYKVRAKFIESGASVGESVHDPAAPRDVAFKCTCTIDKTCPCEHANVEKKTGTVPAGVVHDFLRALATHGFPKPPTPGMMAKHESYWSDDYPRGHVAVFVPGEQAPLHFSFWDQKRAWRFNGKTLSEEPPKGQGSRIAHPYTWAVYRRLLDRAGLSAWGQKK